MSSLEGSAGMSLSSFDSEFKVSAELAAQKIPKASRQTIDLYTTIRRGLFEVIHSNYGVENINKKFVEHITTLPELRCLATSEVVNKIFLAKTKADFEDSIRPFDAACNLVSNKVKHHFFNPLFDPETIQVYMRCREKVYHGLNEGMDIREIGSELVLYLDMHSKFRLYDKLSTMVQAIYKANDLQTFKAALSVLDFNSGFVEVDASEIVTLCPQDNYRMARVKAYAFLEKNDVKSAASTFVSYMQKDTKTLYALRKMAPYILGITSKEELIKVIEGITIS
jgi:hypothetical protein